MCPIWVSTYQSPLRPDFGMGCTPCLTNSELDRVYPAAIFACFLGQHLFAVLCSGMYHVLWLAAGGTGGAINRRLYVNWVQAPMSLFLYPPALFKRIAYLFQGKR